MVVPLRLNTGFRALSALAVMPSRTPSSLSTRMRFSSPCPRATGDRQQTATRTRACRWAPPRLTRSSRHSHLPAQCLCLRSNTSPGAPTMLQPVNLSGCGMLTALPMSLGALTRLQVFFVHGAREPKT